MSEMTNGRQVAVGSPPRRYSFYRSSPFTHAVTAGSKQATMRTTAVLTKQHSHVVRTGATKTVNIVRPAKPS